MVFVEISGRLDNLGQVVRIEPTTRSRITVSFSDGTSITLEGMLKEHFLAAINHNATVVVR